MLIEQYAYRSSIKEVNPNVKLFFSLVFLGLAVFTQHLITLACIFIVMIVTTTLIGKIPLSVFIKLLWLPSTFLGVGVLGIIISYSSSSMDLLFSISMFHGFLGMTKAGITQGTFVFFKALTATSCLYFLILNTPMIHLMVALKTLKIPVMITVLMELMYRFIFIVMDSANGIYVAQKSRLGYSSYKKSYNALGKLASVLFVRSFIRIDELFRAMESRGYNGEIHVLDEMYQRGSLGYLVTTLLALGLVLVDGLL